MRIVFITGILIILVIVITILIIEGLITYRDSCHATVVYDFCVPKKMEKIDGMDDPLSIVKELEDVTNNSPYLYRQAFVLSMLEALLMTNFLYVSFPMFELRNFFYLFFMCFIFNSFVYAFVNFHYYDQKKRVMKKGLSKLETMLQPPSPTPP